MSSALQTESTKLQNENCTIHAKRTPIYIVISKIIMIKWPKSEEKINFGSRWVWLSESSPTQNFVVTAWPWPHLCHPAAAASAFAPRASSEYVIWEWLVAEISPSSNVFEYFELFLSPEEKVNWYLL